MLLWEHLTIKSDEDLDRMINTFNTNKEFILVAAFDTETDRLHHIYAKPFLFQFGFATNTIGYTYAVDLELYPELARRVITIWNYLAETVDKYAGHNIKYDLHQCINIGIPYKGKNVVDTMNYIRFASDAIPERKGGVPLGLKKFAQQYVSPKAKEMDTKIQEERAATASALNNKLKIRLQWTKKQIDEFFKDKLNTKEDLPTEKRQAYQDWLDFDVPLWLQGKFVGAVDKDDIPYSKCDREVVTYYGHLDIVWTIETFLVCDNVIKIRENEKGLYYENGNIHLLVDMERVGFKIDFNYLLQAQKDMKEYIRQRRKDLCIIANKEIKSSQNKEILFLLRNSMDVQTDTTGAEELERICSDLKHADTNPRAVEFIETLQELRTLEKWYSTYLMRFILNFDIKDGKLYTMINTAGAVSGRVTSDFQQFPKDAIVTIDGRELFNPRKMVLAEDGDFWSIIYLDYSQIELRLQAMYTILVGHPDFNLCRAYSPYQCHTWTGDENHQIKKQYDYNDRWCIQHAYSNVWYYDEEPDKKWVPLDVHGATTKIAFGVTEDDPEFHRLRYEGKRVNFAKNYGAQRGKIKQMFPKYSDEMIDRINDAYYKAFPGVERYHDYCYAMANKQPYMQNLFGIKYYHASGHNLINMLVQGTGAYFLKWKKMQVAEFMKQHKMKSKFMMEIHDELQFKVHKDDDVLLFFEIKKIMEDWSDTLIPIIADMEITTTTWADKIEIEKESDLIEIKSNYKSRFRACV